MGTGPERATHCTFAKQLSSWAKPYPKREGRSQQARRRPCSWAGFPEEGQYDPLRGGWQEPDSLSASSYNSVVCMFRGRWVDGAWGGSAAPSVRAYRCRCRSLGKTGYEATARTAPGSAASVTICHTRGFDRRENAPPKCAILAQGGGWVPAVCGGTGWPKGTRGTTLVGGWEMRRGDQGEWTGSGQREARAREGTTGRLFWGLWGVESGWKGLEAGWASWPGRVDDYERMLYHFQFAVALFRERRQRGVCRSDTT